VSFLEELYVHMEWADSVVWRATLTSGEGCADPVLLDTLVHLHLAQHAFLEVWKGESVTLRDRSDFDSAREIESWARKYHVEAKRFLDTLSSSAVDGVITIPWAKLFEDKLGRPAEAVTLSETIYQVAAHSMHHRGQATRRLREIGVEPPLVDYIAWLWMGRPEPEWSS